MKKYIILILLLLSAKASAQDVMCEDLMKYVVEEGRQIGLVGSMSLLNSTWLKEVTAYSIEEKIVVIAEIKKDDMGYNTKKYVFCGIPKSNWDEFYITTGWDKTYGEKFHLYIKDYICNCK